MAAKKVSPTNVSSQFMQEMFRDSVSIPYTLLCTYGQMGLNAQELIILLRLLYLSHRKSALRLADIAHEFDCGEAEALALIRPFVSKEIIAEQEPEAGTYDLDGLVRQLYEAWAIDKRRGQRGVRRNTKAEAQKRNISVLGKLYRSFERELGRNLSPIENEKISHWLDTEQQTPELIEEALKRAVLQGKASFAYIDKILFNWKKQGIQAPAEIEAKDKPPAAKKTERAVKSAERVKDTWLHQ